MRPALPLTLLGAAILIAGAIAYEMSAPLDPDSVTVAPAVERAPRITKRAPIVPPPEDRFADIDARPLFATDRKPLADAAAGGPSGAPTDLSLVGVIMDGARAVALIRNKTTSQSSSAMVGESVDGWRVARIDPTSVTLHSSGGDFVVPLEGPSDRPSSAPLPSSPAPSQSTQSDWSVSPPATAAPNAPTVAASAPVPTAPSASPSNSPKPPARPASTGTIAPEALKAAPRDPKTGEPTL